VPVGHDGVVATLHVLHGGRYVMALGQIGSSVAGMVLVELSPWVQQ